MTKRFSKLTTLVGLAVIIAAASAGGGAAAAPAMKTDALAVAQALRAANHGAAEGQDAIAAVNVAAGAADAAAG
jgi:hypothetical protein